MRCACERIFNLHVEQHDRDIDCSHFSGWPSRHLFTAPAALTMQPGVVARNVHDHSLFLLLRCAAGSSRARDTVAHSQSRCVSGSARVCVTVAVSGHLWQSWTGSLPVNMKDFPAKAGADGLQLFPSQSAHDILFSIKCDDAADGQAAVDDILHALGDHVLSKLLIRGFKFNGGKDLTGDEVKRSR
jgi:deferrochelatase/peroxidase EfeB